MTLLLIVGCNENSEINILDQYKFVTQAIEYQQKLMKQVTH